MFTLSVAKTDKLNWGIKSRDCGEEVATGGQQKQGSQGTGGASPLHVEGAEEDCTKSTHSELTACISVWSVQHVHTVLLRKLNGAQQVKMMAHHTRGGR